MKSWPLLCLTFLVFLLSRVIADDAYFDETQVTTLFAFDEVSIPFTQNLRLEMHPPKRHPANPVVERGKPGSPDSWAVQFYGSILREGNKLRMWYVAVGDDRFDRSVPRSSPWRVAYAESEDGLHWTKPNLGLVDYHGNRDNNLVRMEPRLGTVNVKVIHDPESLDPSRRYKMGAHVWWPKNDVRLGTLAPYGSADGLDWKLLIDAEPVDAELREEDLVLPALHVEPVGGLYRWDGLFHLSGQNAIPGARPYHGRVVRKFVSPDFVRWSPTSAIGFVRASQHEFLGPGRSREGEQNHEAISVWHRHNVLLGISGVWHGGREWEDVTVDLGFVVSNDGVHFRHPLHEWTFLERGKDGAWDEGGLLQGQGFENIDEQTFIYYGAWDPRAWRGSPPRGGVGIAVLPRDRFADLRVSEVNQGQGTYQMEQIDCQFMTKSIDLKPGSGRRISLNASGLGEEAALRVELLGHDTRPLPEFSGSKAALVTTNGYQTPVVWSGREQLEKLPDRIRLLVTFEGKKRNEIRFSAIYVR